MGTITGTPEWLSRLPRKVRWNAMSALIYLVDDEALLLELGENVLRSNGYAVKTFMDPIEALETFASAAPRPRLLVTDFAMDNMNGLELIEKCRELEPTLKTLMLSGTVSREIMKDSAVKADEFIGKPYRVKDLLFAVHRLLASA